MRRQRIEELIFDVVNQLLCILAAAFEQVCTGEAGGELRDLGTFEVPQKLVDVFWPIQCSYDRRWGIE
jgi:hypothetical protein